MQLQALFGMMVDVDVEDIKESARKVGSIGAFIREQREQAQVSVRQLAKLTGVSNPYLSQIERGLHQPSVRVIRLIADALNVSVETLLTQAGLVQREEWTEGTPPSPAPAVEAAIEAEDRLTAEQKAALIAVYHSMLKVS